MQKQHNSTKKDLCPKCGKTMKVKYYQKGEEVCFDCSDYKNE